MVVKRRPPVKDRVDKKPKEWEKHRCGECALCEPVTLFHTLTVHGRKPTLGTCPHREFKVLLSEKACKLYKSKTV